MLKADWNCKKLLFCQPSKGIEVYYHGYTYEINHFMALAQQYCEIETLPMWDIWMRDFMPIPMSNGFLLFQYLPNYQTKKESYESQKAVRHFFPNLVQQKIILDGGHLVFNSKGIGILTEHVLMLNHSPRSVLESKILQMTGLKQIVWLPWNSDDITGHADGFCQFLTDDILCVNDDRNKDSMTKAYYEKCVEILHNQCPQIQLVPIPCQYDARCCRGFPSCCGIYTNFVQVEKALFVPTYNLKLDSLVLRQFESITDKPVVPVCIENTALHGGSLHCLTRNV